MTTDYGAWQAVAKAQAVEQRMDALTSSLAYGITWVIVTAWYNGWGVYAGRNVGVKLIDQGHAVRVSGAFSGGTLLDGTQVFFVGSPYWPGRYEGVPIACAGSGVTAGAPYLEFGPDGAVKIYGAGGITGAHWHINGEYPLDTTP